MGAFIWELIFLETVLIHQLNGNFISKEAIKEFKENQKRIELRDKKKVIFNRTLRSAVESTRLIIWRRNVYVGAN